MSQQFYFWVCMYPKEIKSVCQRDVCTLMSIVAFLVCVFMAELESKLGSLTLIIRVNYCVNVYHLKSC